MTDRCLTSTGGPRRLRTGGLGQVDVELFADDVVLVL
jgi:hypothetical protein